MNPTNNTSDFAREEQAALWAARLDGDQLTTEARQELESWLQEDPGNRALLAEFCQLSADLEETLPALLANDAVSFPPEPAARRTRRRLSWIVGTGLAAAAIAVIFWVLPARSQIENVATPAAQRQSLALVDGSTVELDARTSLRVDIDGQRRRVSMAEGEAFFAVAKDPDRPFVVETPVGSVRVTGTRFDVRTPDSTSLTVTVQRGTVRVNIAEVGKDAAPVNLTVGEQLILRPGHLAVRRLSEHELDATLAWRQGQVVFKGTPLREALARFARYHGIGITATPAAARERIGGRYSLDDLNGFFNALEEVLPVRVSRNLNGTVQVEMRQPDPSATGRNG